jgi:hypothetical protein
MTTAAVASLALASAVTAVAWGHIPGVGNGLAPTTNGPDLTGVQVIASDLNDVLPEQARVCFDQNLSTVVAGPAGGYFALQTYDARRTMNPTTASRDTTNEKCAVLSFAPGTDITQATVGEVVPGAVTDLQSRTNTIADEPTTGSLATKFAGATTGPDLTAVAVNAANAASKLVSFGFDESINPTPAPAYQAANFGFYDATDNQVAAPAGAVSISGKTATVNFGATPGVETATRFFINAGAVEDRPQTNALGALPLTTPSSPDVLNKGAVSTSKPEMVTATPIGAQDFKVDFNVAVNFTPASAGGFIAITDDGSAPAAATAIGSGGAANSVIVTFPASVANDPGGIVRIFLAPGSVTAVGGTLPNVAGQAPTSTPNSVPGFTNGPDLLAVGVDPATSRVLFKYDENVESTTPPAASAFQGAAVDGTAINAIGGVVVSANTVTALFPPSVASAVLFANPFNTVPDKTGRPNPHQSVSRNVQTAPAPPPPPPAPLPPPAATKFKTTVTIHRRGRVYYGTVKSSNASCKKSRRVYLKRSAKKYGSAISKRTGKYSIKRSKRLGGRVYVTVNAKGTCRSAKSRKIRG